MNNEYSEKVKETLKNLKEKNKTVDFILLNMTWGSFENITAGEVFW